MKKYKDLNNIIWEFEDNCFDEKGQVINEIVIEKIELNSLVSVTDEEADEIRNYKSSEQLAEEERLAKFPSQEDLEKAKFEIIAIEMLMQLKEEGVI